MLARLVNKIIRGEFVNMAELSRNNCRSSASRRKARADIPMGQAKRSQREILNLCAMLWHLHGGSYKQAEQFRGLLAYQTLIVQEAHRCGGKGWLMYDRYF